MIKKRKKAAIIFASKIIILVFILIMISALAFKLIKNNKIKNKEISCSHPEVLTNFIKSLIEEPQKIEKEGFSQYHISFLNIDWKRNSSEPFVTYPGNNAYRLYFNQSSFDELAKILDEKLTEKFQKDGYLFNQTSSYHKEPNPNSTNVWEFAGFYRYAYEKNEELYLIELDADKPENSSLVIHCGTRDKKLDAFYDELFNSPNIQKEVKEYNAENNLLFSANDVLNDDLLQASFSTIHIGLGVGAILQKENDAWNILYMGHDYPICQLLEDNNAKPGVDCYDELKDVIRKTI